jgi:hypothetical protein
MLDYLKKGPLSLPAGKGRYFKLVEVIFSILHIKKAHPKIE